MKESNLSWINLLPVLIDCHDGKDSDGKTDLRYSVLTPPSWKFLKPGKIRPVRLVKTSKWSHRSLEFRIGVLTKVLLEKCLILVCLSTKYSTHPSMTTISSLSCCSIWWSWVLRLSVKPTKLKANRLAATQTSKALGYWMLILRKSTGLISGLCTNSLYYDAMLISENQVEQIRW